MIFILRRLEEEPEYDAVNGFVIRAGSHAHARRIASENAKDEGPSVWMDVDRSTCNQIGEKGLDGVILKDVNEG